MADGIQAVAGAGGSGEVQRQRIQRHMSDGSSVKGESDWSDKRAGRPCGRDGDADRLLELSRQAQRELGEDSAERQQIVAAAELLGQLLLRTSGPMTE